VDASAKRAWVERMRAEGDARYRIWPEGTRDRYFPVAYLEPARDETAAIRGLDMRSVDRCRVSMDRARDSGLASATAKFECLPLPPSSGGFLIHIPVYQPGPVPHSRARRRATLRGYVFAHVDLEPVFTAERKAPLAMQFYAGRTAKTERLLFRSHPPEAAISKSLVTDRRVQAAGRKWTLRLAATSAFEREPYVLVLLLVGVGGGLISLLLAGITWSESTARAGAEAAASSLERSRHLLLEADHAKDRFLTVLGHELRNPLGAVKNALLVMRQRGPSSPQGERALLIVERQVAHQSRLVDDLLDVSRISTGKIELKRHPVDFGRVAERVIEAIRWQAVERRQELVVSTGEQPLVVDADPARLEQVVWNLVANAIKCTPDGGTVRVGLQHVDRDDDRSAARLTVSDSGIGLTAEECQQVFNMFAQAEPAASRAPGGLGIGLTLVEQIVTLHGGTVEVHSEGRDCGAEFSVELPISSASVADSEPSVLGVPELAANVDGHERRVLVIEDNADAREMLCELLLSQGVSVESAPDGETGVQLALEHAPDVVLVDLELPGINGFEVARRIRAGTGGGNTLIVALTGYGQSQERERAAEVGFDDYLLKPLDLSELNAVLDRNRRDDIA
jgi:signal transduction histidine kinase/ActR/RegA family two-component response regulator